MDEPRTYTAFVGNRYIAQGTVDEILPAVKPIFDRDPGAPLLIFQVQTGGQEDFDLRGSLAEVLARVALPTPHPAPGRPKLGVVSREVSLLPRHWAWLQERQGGASAALRRLVDQARKQEPGKDGVRQAKEATYRFITAIAGNYPNYEEATRALYASDRTAFEQLTAAWPVDVRDHALRMGEGAFAA
jgi:hypothetical protein